MESWREMYERCVEERAEKYKEDQPARLQKKEEALRTTVGRGLLFITKSLIRIRQGQEGREATNNIIHT